MRTIMIVSSALLLASASLASASLAQETGVDAARENAVDHLVGQWRYEVCHEDGDCDTVVRIFEESEETGLVRYTEFYNGEENEGFVGYDLENDGFVEYDYPADWNSAEFEDRYRSEDASINLFGEYDVGKPDRRMLEWRIDEDGDTLYIRALGSEIAEEPADALGVIFSRVPIVGDDPIIGGGE